MIAIRKHGRFMAVGAALALLAVIVGLCDRTFWLFALACFCFWGSLFLVPRKYHWPLYLWFGVIIVQYGVVIPLLVAMASYLAFTARIAMWLKVFAIVALALVIHVFYFVPGGRRIELTPHLNQTDVFAVYVHSPRSLTSVAVIVREKKRSDQNFYLSISHLVNGEKHAITIPQTKRGDNNIYFYPLARYFEDSGTYSLQITSDATVPEDTAAILQLMVFWGRATLHGFEFEVVPAAPGPEIQLTD